MYSMSVFRTGVTKKQNKLKVILLCNHPEKGKMSPHKQIIQYFCCTVNSWHIQASTPLLVMDKAVHCMSKLDIIVRSFHMKYHTLICS